MLPGWKQTLSPQGCCCPLRFFLLQSYPPRQVSVGNLCSLGFQALGHEKTKARALGWTSGCFPCGAPAPLTGFSSTALGSPPVSDLCTPSSATVDPSTEAFGTATESLMFLLQHLGKAQGLSRIPWSFLLLTICSQVAHRRGNKIVQEENSELLWVAAPHKSNAGSNSKSDFGTSPREFLPQFVFKVELFFFP